MSVPKSSAFRGNLKPFFSISLENSSSNSIHYAFIKLIARSINASTKLFRVAIAILFLNSLALAATYTCDANFYQLRQVGGTSNLYLLDTNNLSSGGVAQWSTGFTPTLNGLGYNRGDEHFYALNIFSNGTTPFYQLYKLDSVGAVKVFDTTIPTGDQIAAATVDKYGVMYIKKLATDNTIYRIQLPTTPGGTIVELASITLSQSIPAADMAFNPIDKKLYVVYTANIPTSGTSAAGTVYEVNLATGGVTVHGLTTPVAINGSATNPLGSVFFNTSGVLYAYQNGGVFGTINLTNGDFTYLNGASSASQSDGASCVFSDQKIDVVKSVGTATSASATTFRFPYTVIVKNTGNAADSNIQITEDLNRVFTTGNPVISISTAPTIVSGTATRNTSFNGTTDTRLLMGTDRMNSSC